MAKVAVIFHHIGPYHHARLNSAGKLIDVVGIEWSASEFYKWGQANEKLSYEKISLFDCVHWGTHNRKTLESRLLQALEDIKPNVVAVNGWNDFGSIITISACLKTGIPTILMSESMETDQSRMWWKEFVKSRILSLCSGGLVGGTPHSDYLVKLGIPRDRIFTGYDVVDNLYFSNGSDAARKEADVLRTNLNLPQHYFLASSRFVPKKNLKRLLQAYAKYRENTINQPWKLVLLGDGELKPLLQQLIQQLNLGDSVLMLGFKQYAELPVYYGLAEVFIHASTTEQWGLVVNEAMASRLPVIVSENCGCAKDLVQNGLNGYIFRPYDIDLLAKLMMKISSEQCDRLNMGKISLNIINQYSPETFAENLLKTVKVVFEKTKPQVAIQDKIILNIVKSLSRV